MMAANNVFLNFADQTSTAPLHSIPPTVTIQSGDTITFDCADASNGQIQRTTSTSAIIATLDFAKLNPVSGPVSIDGAEPGDTLQVDVLALEPGEWGWTGVIPGFGILAEEFDRSGDAPALKIWELDKINGCAWFDRQKGIRIPLKPFCGEMGVARKESGQFSVVPPYHTGGNIDTRHLGVGSTVYLPIEVKGALFSCGVCKNTGAFASDLA
jgi:acetamidase/formamidase